MTKRDDMLTAVRVRGKRRAAASEKWPTGKHRAPELRKRPLQQVVSSSERSSSGPRKRKQKTLEDELPLERLPAEVLQQIFEYSANIELPLVSRQLASKLSKSNHLQHQLTSQLLNPVLGQSPVSIKQLVDATRLLNSKFMTWQFFLKWLLTQSTSTESMEDGEEWDINLVRAAWLALQPSPALLPPKKLLTSPFNQEKTQFLAILSHNVGDLAGMDGGYGELGHEGLVEAIRDGQREVIFLLLSMGLSVSTDILRVAVTEAGCDEEVVRMLVEHAANAAPPPGSSDRHAHTVVDLLDPILWAWADEAQKSFNPKGKWLVEFLRDAQQRKRHLHPDNTHQGVN